MNFWLSIDTDADGTPMPYVDVWSEQPKGTRADKYIAFVSQDGQLTTHLVSLSRATALDEFGTAPDNPRQIIRVGRRLPTQADVDAYLERLINL